MKPYKQITVYRWYSKNKYQKYIFDKDELQDNIDKDTILIKEYIYIDDNIDDALNKIGLYINNIDKSAKNLFYCWGKTSLSHKIKKKHWDGYNINPFLSVDRNSSFLNESITYIFNTNSLFNLSKINIVFDNDK